MDAVTVATATFPMEATLPKRNGRSDVIGNENPVFMQDVVRCPEASVNSNGTFIWDGVAYCDAIVLAAFVAE